MEHTNKQTNKQTQDCHVSGRPGYTSRQDTQLARLAWLRLSAQSSLACYSVSQCYTAWPCTFRDQLGWHCHFSRHWPVSVTPRGPVPLGISQAGRRASLEELEMDGAPHGKRHQVVGLTLPGTVTHPIHLSSHPTRLRACFQPQPENGTGPVVRASDDLC